MGGWLGRDRSPVGTVPPARSVLGPRGPGPQAGNWTAFRIAGQIIWLDHWLECLEPYAVPAAREGLAPPSGAPADVAVDWTSDAMGQVGGVERQVAVRHGPAGTWLDVDGVVALWVAPDGSSLSVLPTPTPAPATLLRDTVTGPGLVFALACQGKYCLHASAVVGAVGAVAFMGDSAAGKSTLAALLDAPRAGSWTLAADDILPVAVDAGRPVVRPDFPQLKLTAEEQAVFTPGPPLPRPLAAVYELAATESGASEQVVSRTLPSHTAAIALLAHTVAARLFPPAIARHHLDTCISIASKVPVRQLLYPRRIDVAPAVSARLTADLALDL